MNDVMSKLFFFFFFFFVCNVFIMQRERILPVVKFSSGDLVVGMEEWTIDMGGKVLASRSQIPLALAWCLR
jgi:hypothetical protein